MKLLRSSIVSALLILAAVSIYAVEEKPNAVDTVFKLSDWSYGRERKTITGSNRVTGTVKVQNISKAAVSDVSLTLVYATGLGEKVAGPIVQKFAALKPGETKALNFVTEFVPAFQSYTFTIAYNGNKKEQWYGNSDLAQPEPRPALIKGDANVVILGKEASVDKNGVFNATVHVKNEGTEVAKNVKVFVTFVDLKKNKIKEWSAQLGDGTVAGGAEKNIPFSFSGAPKNYGGYSIKLSADDAAPEAALAGGDFAGVADIEFAHFKFEKGDAKSGGYKVTADCRNGLKTAADHIKLSLIFYGAKHKEVKRYMHEVVEQIASGGIKTIEFEIPGLPAYEEYEQKISYNAIENGPVKKAADAPSTFKFENKADVEVVFANPVEGEDKSIVLNGAVRNGKSVAVKDVTIRISLLNDKGREIGNIEKVVPGVIEHGAERTFSASTTKSFARFSFEFKSSPAEAGGAEKKDKKNSEADALKLAL